MFNEYFDVKSYQALYGLSDKEVFIVRFLKVSIFILSILTVFPAQALQVITHASLDVKALTVSQLRRIYTMRQLHWANNTPIVVFVLPSKHSVHKNFSKKTLNIFPYKLDRIWNKLTFSGLGVAPKVVQSQAELQKAVSETPGAIGYVEEVNKDVHVNVIQVSI